TAGRPGHPVLIRISYHPRWKATTGERVWLAAPSFMLVFPKGERIELYFDGGWPVTLGDLLTAAGCVIVVVGLLPVRRRLLEALRPVLDLPPIPAAAALVLATGRWSGRTRGAVLGAGLAVVAVVFGVAGVAARASDADGTYRQGQTFYGAGRLAEAVPFFERARHLGPLWRPARPGPSTPASASPRWRGRGRAADPVHRRHTGLRRGGDRGRQHGAPARLPGRPRARVRGDHRLERLDRLDHRARRRPLPPLQA